VHSEARNHSLGLNLAFASETVMQLTNSDLASMQQMILITTDVSGIFGKHVPHNRLFVW